MNNRVIVPTTQEGIVKQNLKGEQFKVKTDITERISVPGLDSLHLRPIEEIGRVLANVIKSRQSVRSITYVIGSHIEITSESDTGTNF